MIPETVQTSTGATLHTRHWHHNAPKGVILLLHGLGEHSGRYDHVAEALNIAGYAVVSQDHVGHGKSEGEPRAHVTTIQTHVDNLAPLWEATQATYPNHKYFVLGHSMGGNIAIHFTLRHQEQLAGLITSGTGLILPIPAFLMPFMKSLAGILPRMPTPPIGSETLSHDPAIVADYDSDPLNHHGGVSLGMAAALAKGGDAVYKQAHTLHLPLLILHGEDDKLIPHRASQKLYDLAGSDDKTLYIYPTLFHEILNEPSKDEILKTIISWLLERS